MLLGCLMKQTQLLFSPQYPLARSDFSPVPLHKVIFNAIVKMAQEGCNSLTIVEIDNYLQSHPEQLEIATDNNFMEFVETTKELSSTENYEAYYKSIRKFSLLRDLKSQGFDITDYYDEAKDETDECANLEKYSIQDILNDVELKGVKLRNKYDVNYVRDEIRAGEDVEDRLTAFEEQPAFGALLQSGYLSTIWNGWNRGHLGLRGGGSGSGKSRLAVADLTCVGAKEIWSEEFQDFIPNENYQSPTLFIHTEQKSDTEVEPMFWASVAGVEYRHIINGLCTQEEKQRVLKAGEIIKQSNLTITSMPNFTTKTIERKIKQMAEQEGIGYMVFDYMEKQADMSQEYKNLNGSAGQEYQILLALAGALKQFAEKYNVGILTGMQLNSEWKQMQFVDESALAGSKSCKNKVDFGSIIIPTNYLRKDLKIVEPLLKRKGFGTDRMPMPNICEFIFKGRYSTHGDERIKLWSYFDKGTFRRYDYLVTNDINEPMAIKPTVSEDF